MRLMTRNRLLTALGCILLAVPGFASLNMMVADQHEAVVMFRDQIGTAMDADVKQYAEELLPKLEMHLEKAQRLQSKLFRATRS